MGHIHEVAGDNYFGLEERRESFKILFGGDREEHGVFVFADDGVSGSIELDFERVADLLKLLTHPAILFRLQEMKTFEEKS